MIRRSPVRPKPLSAVAAAATALVSIGGAWLFFDLPVPAMRPWVLVTVSPFERDSIELLRTRQRLYQLELYSYESKATISDSEKLYIQELNDQIAEVERLIANRTR